MKRVWVWLPVVGLTALLGVFALRLALGDPPAQSPLLGQPAPSFVLTDLDTGEAFDLSDARGEIVVINFWASWCPPCRDEHPALVAVANTYPDVHFVGVTHQDEPAASREFLDELGRGSTTRYLVDPGSVVGIQYGIFGLPETFFVDRAGVVVAKITGPADIATLLSVVEAVRAGERPGLIVAGEVQAVPGS